MMIDVTVANVDLDLAALYTQMNPLVAAADLIRHNRSELIFVTASHDRYVITGSDLHWGSSGLSSGTAESLSLIRKGVQLVSFANLQTTGDVLWAAMQAENTGSDAAALTHLLVHHCWTYHGSTGVDYFPETTLTPFGTLNPTGNDRVYLNGGDDVFFTGGARDTVFGDAGNDQIAGGSENDVLYGGVGEDSLYGGSEDDQLLGGAGRDVLSGGDGTDTLIGGPAADQMTGGAGADVFIFGNASGRDVITDFTPGLDHMQITSADPINLTDLGDDCLVQFGQNTVLLQGVSAAELGDFVFL